MRVVTWNDGRVSIQASVAVSMQLTGAALRNSYGESIRRLTLGFLQLRDDTLRVGPVVLLHPGRFCRAAPSAPDAGDRDRLSRRMLEPHRANARRNGDEAAGGLGGRLTRHPDPIAPTAGSAARVVARPAPNPRRDRLHRCSYRQKERGGQAAP